ncbi:DUF488 family protein [Prescottella subtropica]|uniref:DUF488 domain-containing protein n=1 Tax=Prescottella subtropica TaxID=2545757 RepID=UPI0010F56FD4|nr:DUF488 domain-containing protein [Prescottella subtropica]
MPLFSVGHGRLTPVELTDLLRSAGVETVVDVRRFPGSRRNPGMSRDAMAGWLPDAGLDYHHDVALGGRRRLEPGRPVEDPWWRVPQFAAYAAHTRTDEFRDGLARLLEQARRSPTVMLCSESVWWRCHRRLVADVAVLLHDENVQHILPGGRCTAHVPAAGARVRDGQVYWDLVPDSAAP